MLLLLALQLPVAALAFAIEARGATTTSFCAKVTSRINAAHAQLAATHYCDYFLGIKTVTSTVNQGPSTITVSSGQCTATTTSVSTATATVTGFASDYPCLATSAGRKRGAKPSKPGCFSTYSKNALIFSACSCLSLPTPTVTVTKGGSVNTVTTCSTTSTSTVTSVTTSTSIVPVTQFFMMDEQSGNYAYLDKESYYYAEDENRNQFYIKFAGSETQAQIYFLDDSCTLTGADSDTRLITDPQYGVQEYSFTDGPYLQCSIDPDSLQLLCGGTDNICTYSGTNYGTHQPVLYPDAWYINPAGSTPTDCVVFTNIAVPQAG